MSYTAKIRTGRGPLLLPVKRPSFLGDDCIKLKKGTQITGEVFDSIPVEQTHADRFLREYARRRNLILDFDPETRTFVSYNPRYNTFRYANIKEDKYDLLSIVDPEFIEVIRS
jgi:hypothetical protein